jgi:hypothetical protein
MIKAVKNVRRVLQSELQTRRTKAARGQVTAFYQMIIIIINKNKLALSGYAYSGRTTL